MLHVNALPYQTPTSREYQNARRYDSFYSYGTTGFNLADFLNKSSDTSIAGDIIDPLCFFDVEFKFFPTDAHQNENTFLYKLVEKTYTFGSYARNTVHITDQLAMQLGMYVQAINVPNMLMPEATMTPTLFGEFPVNNTFVKPDNNKFTMTLLNTQLPLHDYLFYPWMREATLPKWSYAQQPYTTANVYISFAKHSNVQYVFAGARPTQINSRQPTQQPDGEPTRDVVMLFDYMFILPTNPGDKWHSTWGAPQYETLTESSVPTSAVKQILSKLM